ncbi:hypothetical protein LRS12_12930 [Sphingomonas sp. J344]|uniref:hypothetical protein n=2 Tax=unclassified Sphingomonas TaxID=196159 RepID=UPI002151FE02|nr:hypothetical protein [Sphingomonas sp. J344]MCR5871540.1 hypothetical protein [Sphingomonas sp. J344]
MVSMGSVWDRTAEFLSDNLGNLLPIALLAIFVPTTISANLSSLQPTAPSTTAMWLGLGVFLLALVSFWGQLAVTALAIDPSLGRDATRVATRRFPAALLLAIVMLVAGLLLVIPLGVMLAVAGVDLSGIDSGTMPTIPESVTLWASLYGLVIIVLAVWVFARLAVVVPAIVGDRLAIGAIARSWSLTRGVALKVVGVLILYAIVSIVANLAATTAFGAVMYLVAGRGEDGLSLASVLTTIVGGTVSTGFTVLGTAFLAKLYIALLARKEAAAAV